MNQEVSIENVMGCLFDAEKFRIEEAAMTEMWKSYSFLEDFSREKVIYGINTGFGPMAQWRVSDSHLSELQYNIIRSHSCGMGKPMADVDVKAAMIARVSTFMQARSGIHPEVPELLVEFINRGIYPYIPCHGSVGASGDLVQLAHMALCLIGEGKVHHDGQWLATSEVLAKYGLHPIKIHIREGLSVCNGTSVMTGIGLVNLYQARNLLDFATLASVWMNEIAGSFDDWMAAPLNEVRRQPGQQIVAARMRRLAQGSQCLMKREHELYDPLNNKSEYFDHKVQAYYSLRCTPQILGPVLDTYDASAKTLHNELNSACDNPIVDADSHNVYHGGNFHGDYISLDQDKVKIATVRMAMLAERQLNYLFHDRINGILPPFLNQGTLGLNYGMQACQFTATSTTAECQTLAMPNYVHSIPNNNDNQDIVSMGTNTALLCRQVIENTWQVMSILFIALAQATDCLDIAAKLAGATRNIYKDIRAMMPSRVDDKPFYEDMAAMEKYLKSHPLNLYKS